MTPPRTGATAGRLAGLLCAALLAVAACTSDSKGDGVTAPPTPPVVDVSQAQQQVRGYADRLVTVIGDTKIRNGSADPGHCDGKPDDWYFVTGIYQIFVPAGRHQGALDGVEKYAEQQGFTIKDDYRVPDGRGDITVLNPGDGVTLTLGSGEPPAMVLLVNSPCYRTGEPLP
jgi:hypothetical protein